MKKLILTTCFMLLAGNLMAAENWYAGEWDSNIYNQSEKPRTIAIRFKITDQETLLPVPNAEVMLEGNYTEEFVGRVDPYGENAPKHKRFELSARTDEQGVAVLALNWQKEYPWRTYFGSRPPTEKHRSGGGYRIKDSWIRAIDDIEKVQRLKVRAPGYSGIGMDINFNHLLRVEETKSRIDFEENWINHIQGDEVKLCILDIGNEFESFGNINCTEKEFFERIRDQEYGQVFDQLPPNVFTTGEYPQSICGPYFLYESEMEIEKLKGRRGEERKEYWGSNPEPSSGSSNFSSLAGSRGIVNEIIKSSEKTPRSPHFNSFKSMMITELGQDLEVSIQDLNGFVFCFMEFKISGSPTAAIAELMTEMKSEFRHEGPEVLFPLSMMYLYYGENKNSVYFVFSSDEKLAETFAEQQDLDPVRGFMIMKATMLQ